MSDCLKCSYPKGDPKGERVCKKCGRPENVPKSRGGRYEIPLRVAADGTANQPTDRPIGEVVQRTDIPYQWTEKQPTDRAIANSPPYACPDLDQDYSLDEPITPALPAHSRMGGSAAHRFLNCPGSTALIAGLKLDDKGEDPDWTRDGTHAHALGARCLEIDADAWELVGEYPIGPDQAAAVQVYIDYVRSLPGRRRVEVKMHLPDLHPLMFSTLDVLLNPMLGEWGLHIVDYKHGEGVFVPVEENEQLRYYACMAIMEEPAEYDDADKVRLTIVQPRIQWADPVRSWDTTVGDLKAWLYDVLLPAMRLEAQDMHLQLGEWCRFCPAKLVCPAMSQALAAFAGDTTELAALSDEVLGKDYALTPMVKMRIKAIENEVFRRKMAGVEVPGAKLVLTKTDRVWKDGVIEDIDGSGMRKLVMKFHDEAWEPRKFRSPAQVEKLPEGKEFVREWAYKPEAGYTVALDSDPRAAVVPKTPEEKYGPATKLFDAIGRGVA